MTIPLTGTGGLFTRMGTFGNLLNSINLSRGTTIPAQVAAINAQYETTDQNIINNLYSSLSGYQSSCSQFNSPIRSMTSSTIIQMVNDVLPQSNNNQISTALIYLINQMKSQGQTVQRCTVGSSVAYSPSNQGNPNLVVVMADVNNLPLEYCFAELCTATVTQDAQTNPSALGTETVQIQTQYSISDTFSYLYPQGSGVTASVNAVSGMTNGGGGRSNWLLNGSFETWSPATNGVPTSWHIGTGTAGTTILQSTNAYDGTYALQFLSNGSENTSLYQQFSTALTKYDTNAQIGPNTLFVVNSFVAVSSVPPGGVLRFALTNGSTPINDNSNTPNAISVNLNSLSTVYAPIAVAFRTPNLIPTILRLEIKLTSAPSSGYSVYIDRVAFCQPAQLYAGGPFVTIFSGNSPLIRGDSMSITISNAYNGLNQQFFNKCFGMANLGLILPSSNSPTIADF